ncbi:MAG: VgrG-related protein [Anaerolineae bacterium]
MADQTHVGQISVKVEGALIAQDAVGDLLEVVVDHTLHLPSMFTLRLHSYDMKWLQDPTFREGKKVELLLGERPPIKVASGKIVGLEPDLEQGAPSLVVRGYDLLHKLYRGRHRRSFLGVTDSDLATKLAAEAGLTPGNIDSTSEVHEYVFQNNQTNAEFLLERARRIGYEVWVEDTRLHFRKPTPNGSPVRLKWGETLMSWRPRLSTAEQVNEVEVRGWDPQKKEAVVGRAVRGKGAPEIGIAQPGASIAKEAWGEAKIAIVDRFVRSPSEAEKHAQAALDEASSTFVEAEGTCTGNGDIVPGRQVQIEGVGGRFEGMYYVTQVTHVWTAGAGTVTHFTVSGRRDRSVWSLLEGASARQLGMQMVIGLVTNNKDPKGMGRTKVKFPWLSEQDESAWARVVSPMAGPKRGLFCLPEVNDEVLVGFEHGDIHRPFILGALWNGCDKPPLTVDEAVGGDGKVNRRVMRTRYGHTITLDDTTGKEQITIRSHAGHAITLDDTTGNEQIKISDKSGNNTIVVHTPDNSMQIKVNGNLTIEADGKITLTGKAGIDISSQAMTVLKGNLVDIEGSGPVTVQGQPIKLN